MIDEIKLEAVEMWIYRRVIKIPWTARISNEEVLKRRNVKRQLIFFIFICLFYLFSHSTTRH